MSARPTFLAASYRRDRHSLSSLGAGDWTSEPVSPNFYKIDLSTAGDAGEGAAFEVRVEVRMPSILAGELFISPFLSQG